MVSMGKASEFAGLPQLVFQKILSDRKLSISYDEEEFDKDLAAICEKYGDL